jgi:hypothetical protein
MKPGLNQENSLPDPEFGRESSESARAIHYVVQKDTLMTYVSVLEAQADPGIVSGSTIERKKMSTKTIYKRIALVAVAALGAGVLSVAPASAAYTSVFDATGSSPTLVESTSLVATATQTQMSGPNNFVTVNTTNTAGVVTITGSTLGTAATSGVTIAADKLSASQTDDTAYIIPTKTAGTITVNFYLTTNGVTSTTADDILVITVNDAATYLASPVNSTSVIAKGSGSPTTATVDDVVTASNLGAAGQAANIVVAVKDGTAAKTAVSGIISATIEGPGLIGISASTANTAASARFASLGSAGSLVSGANVTVWADRTGAGGTSTIKIYSGTVLIATETVKFYGAVKTLGSAAVRGSISDAASSGTDLYAAVITAKDTSGTDITLTAGELSVAAADVVAAGVASVTFGTVSAATVSGKAITATDVVMSVTPTSTKTGNKSITVTHTDPVTAVKTTTVVNFTIGKTKATTVTLTTDKATYLPGEKMVLTLTARDAGGFAIADSAAVTDFLAAGGIISSVAISGETTTATDPGFIAGKKSWTVYAPLGTGPVTFSGKTGAGSDAPTTAVTLTATANVAAAADANITALTTLVNSLIAKINALNKLVIKIQKKVRA